MACAALSFCEAEIIAASMAACEVIYLRQLLADIGFNLLAPTRLYIDNKGALELSKDPFNTNSLKHVKRRHFFAREAEENREIACCPISTAANLADTMTKALAVPRFKLLISRCLRDYGGD